MSLNFFQKESLGLDISDHSIEIVLLRGSIQDPKLLAMSRQILEPGIVENGKVVNKEGLKKALKSLISNPKFGKVKTKKFIFSLPESRSFIHVFEIPQGLKKEKEKEEINSRLFQTFLYPPEDLYFDFQIQDIKKDKKEILLVGASRIIVEDYLEVFKSCQFQPKILETESESMGRALISEEKGSVLIADIGARTTNFSVFNNRKLRASITVNIAGNEFTKAIAENLRVSFKEAESLKREIGLNPRQKEGKIFLILQKEIQGIITEIKRIKEYLKGKGEDTVKKIILAGGSAIIPYLSEYLAENLSREVIVGDPWAGINIDILKKEEYFKEALKVTPILYSTVIGSALRGLAKDSKKEGINLLRKKK